MTKHITADALDQIALHGALGELLRHHQPEPGLARLVGAVVKREVTPANDTPKSKNG